jgi:general secretion pathway protein M
MTPRQSRTAAVVILLLLMATVLAVAIYPVWSMNMAYNAKIGATQFQIQRYQRIASQDDRYQQEFNNLKQNQQSDPRYLQSKTDLLANAELQRRIKQVIAAERGEIISTQTAQISQDKLLNKVAIRIRMKATLESLKQILHQLETQKPYLFVDNISLRGRHLPRRRLPTTKDIAKEIRMLDLEFLVTGYIKSSSS